MAGGPINKPNESVFDKLESHHTVASFSPLACVAPGFICLHWHTNMTLGPLLLGSGAHDKYCLVILSLDKSEHTTVAQFYSMVVLSGFSWSLVMLILHVGSPLEPVRWLSECKELILEQELPLTSDWTAFVKKGLN